MRTVFRDEILAAYLDSTDPQYSFIKNPKGAYEFTLLNGFVQEGTKLSANALNNLYDFDNMASQSGFYKKTTFVYNTIVERIYEQGTNVTAAIRDTTFQPNGDIDILEIIYDNGKILRHTKSVVQFTPAGAIMEEVNAL